MKILKKSMFNTIRPSKLILKNSILMMKKSKTDGADILEPWVLKLSANNQKLVFFCLDSDQQVYKLLKISF